MNATDTLVLFGGAVKALGDGKVGGYLVSFSDSDAPDLVGDFFTASTDYDVEDWPSAKSAVYYSHGQDATLGARKLSTASMKIDDAGVWVEAQLAMRDEYEQMVYQMAKDGKLGWSSGTAAHLVQRKSAPNDTWEITRWPLGLDASLTPIPAEPRNSAVTSLKSLITDLSDDKPQAGKSFGDHSESVLATVRDFAVRASGLKELRGQDGRQLSKAAKALIGATASELKDVADELVQLIETPQELASVEDVNRAFAQFQELLFNTTS